MNYVSFLECLNYSIYGINLFHILLRFMDDAGTWLRCCALGRNASRSALQQGMVFYFTLGRGQYGSSPGMVYLMRDSLRVPIEQRAILIPEKMQIVIQ